MAIFFPFIQVLHRVLLMLPLHQRLILKLPILLIQTLDDADQLQVVFSCILELSFETHFLGNVVF